MAKIYPYWNSFNAGEVSELLFNREDITKYKSSCLIMENAFPLVEGGAQKMPGTYFAGPTISNNTVSRLAPFQFSTAQGAILEFSAGIIRIWSPSPEGTWTLGLVEDSMSNVIELVTPYTQDELFELDCSTQSADTLWVFHPNHPPGCVERLSADSWQYVIYPPGGPPVSPGNPAYRGTPDVVTTGYNGLGVSILQVTQAFPAVMVTDADIGPNGQRVYINECAGMVELNEGEYFVTPVTANSDVAVFTAAINDGSTDAGLILNVASVSSGTILVGMQISGPNVTPNTIITADLGGSGGMGTYQVNIPQLVQGSTGMTGQGGFAYNLVPALFGSIFTGSASGTTLTVTAIIAGYIYGDQGLYFSGVAAGTVITGQVSGTPGGVGVYTLNNANTFGPGQIETIPVISTSYLPYQGGGFAVKVVPMFASSGNYPSCGTLYQNRLCVSGTDDNPVTLYGSTEGDYPDFICDPNEDDYSVQFTLVSAKLDQILNLIGTPNAMLAGTASGIFAISGGGGVGTPFTQNSVSAPKQSSIGVSPLQPQLVDSSAIFVSRSAKIVNFVVYNFYTNQWDTIDLTRLNRQITLGNSAGCSGIVQTAFQSEPYPIFWAVRADGQLLGLVFNTKDQVFAWFRVNMQPYGGDIESTAVITSQNQEDMVVVVVNRTVNGATVRYVEYFYPQELFNQLSNAFFVHCGLQLNLGPAISITNITNSNPATVTAPGQTFANGSLVQISAVNGMTDTTTGQSINQDKTQAYTVINSNTGAGTFQLQGMDTTTWTAYQSGGQALPVTNMVTGMSYLLGNYVTAVGDGAIILAPTVVTQDSFTFPYYCAQITIGIPYTMTVQPMNPVTSSQTSTTRGQKQKLNRVTISLYQALGGKYGTDLAHMYQLTYPQSTGGQP